MNDILHRRRHRFDTLFALLTGPDAASLPQTAHLLRDAGLAEATPPIQPSGLMLAARAHRAFH